MIDTTKFNTTDELFKFLVTNKAQLIAQKKFEMKKADAFSFVILDGPEKGVAEKAETDAQYLLSKDQIDVKIVVNTTRLLDSHGDVHIDGLWRKTLKDKKSFYHLQEHKMQFDHVISDDVKAYTRQLTWNEIGVDLSGQTEALMFNSTISKDRNPFMFEQYAKGFVKNHSVGMRYVNIQLCVNSADFAEEKANWDKYIDSIANRKEAESIGYFWAVLEAQLIEGSAVLMGSNWATPTQSIKASEPPYGTQDGPASPPKNELGLFEKLANINF